MFIRNWKKEILTIPNLLSLFRLVLIPVYIDIYLNATTPTQYLLAGSILAVSCVTDIVDGQIARHFHMVTTIGKVLDPLADKATQFTLTVCLSLKYPVLLPVLALLILKETFQLIAMIVSYRNGKALPGALLPGKFCTAVLFLSLIVIVLFPGLDPGLVTILALTDGAFLVFSFTSYIFAYLGRHPKVEDIRHE